MESTATFDDLIDELGAEHEELLPCAVRLLELAGGNGSELSTTVERCTSKLGETLDRHIAQEDEVLFPAYAKESGNEGLVSQFSDEHREIQRLRDEVLDIHRAGGDPQQLGNLTAQLADLLISHIQREDGMLFPPAHEALA